MALGRVLADNGISVELVVPKHVIKLAGVDLVEGGSQRIGGGVADATIALLQSVIDATGIGELLAEVVIGLYLPAKGAGPLSSATAAGQGCRVEFEGKPPVNRLRARQQRGWSCSRRGVGIALG